MDLYMYLIKEDSCKYKNGDARFILKGSIADYREQEINGETYFFTTSEKNEAECNLKKQKILIKLLLIAKLKQQLKNLLSLLMKIQILNLQLSLK